MCLNCGCMMNDDDMGNPDNITTTMIAKAAIASNMNGKDTIENMKAALETLTPEELDKKKAEIKSKI